MKSKKMPAGRRYNHHHLIVSIAIIFIGALLLTACEKQYEWLHSIENGRFVLLDEPYKHPYNDLTIKAVILKEIAAEFNYNAIYPITGDMPDWAKKGDTVSVKAVLKEIYPQDQITLQELSNTPVYKIKYINPW